MKEIYLAGGCFWGMQKFIDQFDGVLHTETGYANGPDKAPSYQDVCADSGHAETVLVEYEEAKMPLSRLLMDVPPRGEEELLPVTAPPSRSPSRLPEFWEEEPLVVAPVSVMLSSNPPSREEEELWLPEEVSIPLLLYRQL